LVRNDGERRWGRGYLHAPKEITTRFSLIPVVVEIETSFFNLSTLFRGTGERVKLPCLPPNEVICRVDVRVIATLRYLQPPHSSFIYIEREEEEEEEEEEERRRRRERERERE
jgi:hypothetical protein